MYTWASDHILRFIFIDNVIFIIVVIFWMHLNSNINVCCVSSHFVTFWGIKKFEYNILDRVHDLLPCMSRYISLCVSILSVCMLVWVAFELNILPRQQLFEQLFAIFKCQRIFNVQNDLTGHPSLLFLSEKHRHSISYP